MDVYSCSEWQTLTGNAVMYWHCGMVEEIESPSTTNKGPVTPRRKLANVCTHWHSFPSCFHLTVQNSCLHGPLPSAFQSQTPLPFSVFPAGLLHIYLFFFLLLAHSVKPICPLSPLEGTHLHLFAITRGWFSQRNFFQVLQIFISQITSIPYVTNLLDHTQNFPEQLTSKTYRSRKGFEEM